MNVEDRYRMICIESPLYSVFKRGEFNIIGKDGAEFNLLVNIENNKLQFDCYCIYCQQNATFVRGAKSPTRSGYEKHIAAAPDTFVVRMTCTRKAHHYFIWFQKNEYEQKQDNELVKIGMYPSMEDIANSDLKKYRGLLGKSYFSELHRAGGLASHGIGIGSFVYMRRIFEKQIMDHYERRVKDNGEINGFESMRMNEKIKAIEDYLPSALVKHREIYGILSTGIHELDEETCLDYYPPLRQAIILILEQDYQIKEKQKAAEALEKSFDAITKGLRGK